VGPAPTRSDSSATCNRLEKDSSALPVLLSWAPDRAGHHHCCSSDEQATPKSGTIRPIGFLDRLLGRRTGPEPRPRQRAPASSPAAPGELTDEQALERYRYLVRTAPPEAIEQAHEEAFAKLTPEQRRMALRDLSAAVPEHERTGGDDPVPSPAWPPALRRTGPGTVERAFGGGGGMLGGMGGTLLGSFAAAFAGSLVAQSLFSEFGGEEAGAAGDGGEGEAGDAGSDAGGGDFGGGDLGGGDVGF
jgi:hypothetical protein